MKNFYISNAWAFYLALVLGFLGISSLTWQFWVLMIPAYILNEVASIYQEVD